ncbi:cell division protein [Bacteroidia bacterium]|nr:cell division protein [Bacteroidia bacterium]
MGLFFDLPVKALTFTAVKTDYTIVAQDTLIVAIVSKGESLQIVSNGAALHVSGGVGNYKEIQAFASNLTGAFSVRPTRPAAEARAYAQNVVFRAKKGNIFIINKVDEDFYLSGVCEAEAGCTAPPDYFKVQSIMSRTYLYAHFDRHAGDGFNLCDGVHCQAYKGLQTRCTRAQRAVAATDGVLVADKDKMPIAPTYSANCGGQTCNSEDVWKNKLPYLRSTKDNYCFHQHGSNWTKRIPLAAWRSYMNSNGLYARSNSDFNFDQSSRKRYYTIGKNKIQLTKIRQQFGLRSAFFSVRVEGNNVVLTGRGYGHGVGVCQEGAMQMAERGISFKKILQYYYKNTTLLDFDDLQPSQEMLVNEHSNIFNPWINRLSLAISDSTLLSSEMDSLYIEALLPLTFPTP